MATKTNTTTQPNSRRKLLIWTAVIVAVLAVGGFAYFKMHQNSASQKVYDTSKPENQQSAVDPKTDTDNAQRQNVAANQPATAGADTTVTPQITYLGQNNGTVTLSATVNGATSGTCKATFKNGGSSITKTSSVTLVTNYYACGDIQVPNNEFSPKGVWDTTVKLDNGPDSSPVKVTIN